MSDNLILEAKNVAVRSITNVLAPHIYNGLLAMYNKASALNKSESIKMFQLSLERIGILPENILKADYKYLISTCNEVELTKNIEILFVCYSKLTINKSKKIKKADLEIPSNQSFLHQCYINSARDIYTCAYLFSHKYSTNEQAQNKERALDKISQAIDKTIRELIPYDTLLRKYITENTDIDSDSDNDSDNDNEVTSTRSSISINKEKEKTNNLISLMNLDVNTEIINKGEDIDNNKLNNENISKLQNIIKSKKEEINNEKSTNLELTTLDELDAEELDADELDELSDVNNEDKIITLDDNEEEENESLPLVTLLDSELDTIKNEDENENEDEDEIVELDPIQEDQSDTESFIKFKEYAKKLNIKDIPIHLN
jgi:hypothetical protein